MNWNYKTATHAELLKSQYLSQAEQKFSQKHTGASLEQKYEQRHQKPRIYLERYMIQEWVHTDIQEDQGDINNGHPI